MRIEEEWALIGVVEEDGRDRERKTEEIVIEIFSYCKPTKEDIKQAIIDYRDGMREDATQWHESFDYYKLEERYTIGY